MTRTPFPYTTTRIWTARNVENEQRKIIPFELKWHYTNADIQTTGRHNGITDLYLMFTT